MALSVIERFTKMALTDKARREINQATVAWRQGDVTLGEDSIAVYLANLARPHSDLSMEAAERLRYEGQTPGQRPVPVVDDKVRGLVMLSQTCDIVRDCLDRLHVVMAPLVEVKVDELEDVELLRRPRFIFVPATAGDCLVADLDIHVTVEKAVLAGWERTPGWETDGEMHAFSKALVRNATRFPFPDDFVAAVAKLRGRVFSKHNRESEEGRLLRKLDEIRLRAYPSWDGAKVRLHWLFLFDSATTAKDPASRKMAGEWLARFDQSGRFQTSALWLFGPTNLSVSTYKRTVNLDFESLSAPARMRVGGD